jgi:hypothetical protein
MKFHQAFLQNISSILFLGLPFHTKLPVYEELHRQADELLSKLRPDKRKFKPFFCSCITCTKERWFFGAYALIVLQ